MKVAVPVLETQVHGKKLVNSHFGKSNLFAIVDTETGTVKEVKNPGLHVPRGRGVFIAEMFKEKGVEAILVKEIGEGAFEKVKSFGMRIFLIPPETKLLEDAIEAFKTGKLSELKEPNEEKEF